MSPAPQLIDIVLANFQKMLRGTFDYKWEPRHGKPPARSYVEHCTRGRDWADKGPALAAWSVQLDAIAATTINSKWQRLNVNGMFYDLARGFFSFTPDYQTVFISWQTGPRYGHGHRHSIIERADGTFELAIGERLWVS